MQNVDDAQDSICGPIPPAVQFGIVSGVDHAPPR
jgi:hypothetical protein